MVFKTGSVWFVDRLRLDKFVDRPVRETSWSFSRLPIGIDEPAAAGLIPRAPKH